MIAAHRCTTILAVVYGAMALLGLTLTAPSSAWAQTSKPPVISLKAFTSVPEWVLDITWNAKDVYEDKDISTRVELTATARYYLKQSDRRDDWGRWEAHSEQSSNIAYTSFILHKRQAQRLKYEGTIGPLMGTDAVFQVGGLTPGYQLDVSAMFPVKVSPALPMPTSALGLFTTEHGSPPSFCIGPLPASGTTIHGSRVIFANIGPFGNSNAPRTRLAIQYVLREHVPDLAPLVPQKKDKGYRR